MWVSRLLGAHRWIGNEKSPSRKVTRGGTARVLNLDARSQTEFRSDKGVRRDWKHSFKLRRRVVAQGRVETLFVANQFDEVSPTNQCANRKLQLAPNDNVRTLPQFPSLFFLGLLSPGKQGAKYFLFFVVCVFFAHRRETKYSGGWLSAPRWDPCPDRAPRAASKKQVSLRDARVECPPARQAWPPCAPASPASVLSA